MSRSDAGVSVIIPAFNAARFLAEAITCALDQTLAPLEVIVVDDGSTDDTAGIADGFGAPVTCLRQANAGPAAARNRGLAAARGDVIAFLDADDTWPADKLALQVARLGASPPVDVVTGRTRYVRLSDGLPLPVRLDADDAVAFIQVGAAVFRRRVFDTIGGFDPTLRQAEDHDLFLRIRERGIPMAILTAITLNYRLHDANMTHDRAAVRNHITRMLKRSLDRRRAEGGNARPLRRWSELVGDE